MKVAVFAGEFPILSETFVMRQVAGLIDGGYDVTVIAGAQGTGMTHEMYSRYKMKQRTLCIRHTYGSRFAQIAMILRFVAMALIQRGRFRQLKAALSALVQGCRASFIDIAQQSEYGSLGQYDAIIAHFGPVGVRAMNLQKAGLLGGSIATIFHGFDMSDRKTLKKYRISYKELFASTARMLPISHLWAERLVAWGAPKEKVEVLRMGVDVDRLEMLPANRPLGSPLRVLSVARFTEKKGLEYAIRGVQGAKCHAVLTVIGSGPLEDELKEMARNLEGRNRVEFLGKQPQDVVFEELDKSDVFLLPSVTAKEGDMEGIPVALMEAMAKGVLVIATRHSGIPELVEHLVSGILVPERSSEDVSVALQDVCSPGFPIASMRLAARERVCIEFNNARLDDQLRSICERMKQLSI